MNPLIRMGPVRQISGSEVRVLCTSKARRAAHAGVFLVNSQTWGLEGRMYRARLHSCRGLERQGCAMATQLRAVASALSIITPETTLQLMVTDSYVARTLRRWQGGDTDLPGWYTPDADDRALLMLPSLLAEYPGLLAVHSTELETGKQGPLARLLLAELLTATRLTPEAGGAHLDATVPSLMTAHLPF